MWRAPRRCDGASIARPRSAMGPFSCACDGIRWSGSRISESFPLKVSTPRTRCHTSEKIFRFALLASHSPSLPLLVNLPCRRDSGNKTATGSSTANCSRFEDLSASVGEDLSRAPLLYVPAVHQEDGPPLQPVWSVQSLFRVHIEAGKFPPHP